MFGGFKGSFIDNYLINKINNLIGIIDKHNAALSSIETEVSSKQNAANAITRENIGEQTVKEANLLTLVDGHIGSEYKDAIYSVIDSKSNCYTMLSGDAMAFRPTWTGSNASAYLNLGTGGYPWKALYATSGTIVTSDRNAKKDFKDLDQEFATNFILDLKPQIYKYKSNDSEREHWGLVAQDVENTIEKLGKTTQEFAGICKNLKTTQEKVKIKDAEFDSNGKIITEPQYKLIDKEIPDSWEYALRYDEFIAPLIKFSQNIYMELQEVKMEIAKLKSEVKELTT